MIFDIREFSVNDGPGARITVFMKGCPLRCRWCHNPESRRFEQERNRRSGEVCGREYTPEELTDYLLKFRDFFRCSGGGVTFSGGEPLAQPDFLEACLKRLEGIHCTLDTSGYAPEKVFLRIMPLIQLYYFDLKLASPERHKELAGMENGPIVRNLRLASAAGKDIVIRIPVIPGMTDTEENLDGLAHIIQILAKPPIRVDLLPFHALAGGKYANFGYVFPAEEFGKTINETAVRKFAGSLKPLQTVYCGKENKSC